MNQNPAIRFAFLALLAVAVGLALGVRFPASAHAIFSTHLHRGTCGNPAPDEPVELGQLGYVNPLLGPAAATPAGPYRPVGPDGTAVTVLGFATADTSLDRLIDEPHAIAIHILDEENPDPSTAITLACGNVGGVRGNGQLVFGLRAVPTAGADTTGIAWLQENGDGTTAVRLFVNQGLPASHCAAAGTPTP